MKKYSYDLFADYFQFYIQDDDETKRNLGDSWTDEAVKRLVAVAPGVVGIGTVRNMDVPVTVEVHDINPCIDLDNWEHVVHCSIQCDTGKLVVAGCTDYYPDAARIKISPGIYEVLACFKGFETLSEDGLDGLDSYHLFLYPGKDRMVTILKSRESS